MQNVFHAHWAVHSCIQVLTFSLLFIGVGVEPQPHKLFLVFKLKLDVTKKGPKGKFMSGNL